VRTSLEHDVDIRESLMATGKDSHNTNAWSRLRRLQHPECFWPDKKVNNFVLSRASIWWYTMAQAWESVEEYERDHGYRFEAVVFSRPDIIFQASMGPWCAYELSRQWYAPWGEATPDMFWVFPRHVARRVLTTWTRVVLPCKPGEACCNMTTRPGEVVHGRSPNLLQHDDGGPVTYSNWLVTYWSRFFAASASEGGTAVTLNHTLRGHGRVAANPARIIYGKPRRNCSMHLGCLPRDRTMAVVRGSGWL
jgi:hypothetical protein